jgi:hypothetical protein
MPALLDFTTRANVRLALSIPASNTLDDARIDFLIPLATSAIVEWLGRDPRSQNYTEFYSGNGLRELALRQRPVTAVSRLNIDSAGFYSQGPNAFPSNNDLIEGTDFAIQFDSFVSGINASRRGILERLNGGVWDILSRDSFFAGGWYGGFSYQYATNTGKLAREVSTRLYGGNILVAYTAGYTTIPNDIVLAATLYVTMLRRTIKFGGWMPQSENLGEYGYSLASMSQLGMAPEVGTIRQLLSRYREVAI